jgi:hypothetical protein
MGYIDTDYYCNTFCGTPVEQTELLRLIERASDIADGLTGFRLDRTAEVSENVKKAVGTLVEHLRGKDADEKVSLGRFSYSKTAADKSDNELFKAAVALLQGEGLLYRGVILG